MNDFERIEALFNEGRITREQADQLISALDASAEAEREVAGLDAGQPLAAAVPAAPESVRFSKSDSNGVHSAHGSAGAAANGSLSRAYRWLEVSAFTGDLDITVNPELTEPRIKDGNLIPTEHGVRVAPWEERDDGVPRNFIDRMIDGFRQSDMDVEIPAGWAVSFDVKGGDIDVRGPVAAVSGQLQAGDLTVTETAAADLTVTAGEADIGLRAASGEHRVVVRVGKAKIRLLPGSSLEVEGSVSIGDLKASGLSPVDRGLGGWASGHLGGGTADNAGKLTASVVTGDLHIRLVDND